MPRRPLDILNVVALLLLIALVGVGALAGRLPDWPTLLLRLGLMLLGVIAISSLARRSSPPPWLNIILNFYPVLLMPLVFDALGPIIPAVNPRQFDDALARIDRALFGVDVTVWTQRLLWPPLTDLMHLAYATYYFFPIIVGVALWRSSPRLAKSFIFTTALGFYISYAGYFLVPAKGPRTFQKDLYTQPLAVTPISRAISHTLDHLENTKLDAFPSGHTMIAVMSVLVTARHARAVFRVLLPTCILLMLSTVYCRYHYVIDVIAGLILAAIMVPLGQRIWNAASPAPPEFGA